MSSNQHNRKLFNNTFISLLHDGLNVDVPVFGLSMFPLYLPGDVVKVMPIRGDEIKIGALVIFLQNERLIAHRLIKIEKGKNKVVTKGDGLVKRDKPLMVSQLCGEVIEHFRNGRKITWTEKRLVKRLCVLVTPLMGVFSFFIGRIWLKITNS